MLDISLGTKRQPSSEEKILKALDVLKANPDLQEYDYCECESTCSNNSHCYVPISVQDAVRDILVHVPKLIEAYAELWAMSMDLADLVQQERAGELPSGLVIPK